MEIIALPTIGNAGTIFLRSGRSLDWLKMKNSDARAVKREAEEDWGKLARASFASV
jgi:hypothetical protein